MCDALLATTPGRLTWAINRDYVDRFFSVDDDAVSAAMAILSVTFGLVVEPSGAVGLAAILRNRDHFRGRRVGIVLSGGNADETIMNKCLATGATIASQMLNQSDLLLLRE